MWGMQGSFFILDRQLDRSFEMPFSAGFSQGTQHQFCNHQATKQMSLSSRAVFTSFLQLQHFKETHAQFWALNEPRCHFSGTTKAAVWRKKLGNSEKEIFRFLQILQPPRETSEQFICFGLYPSLHSFIQTLRLLRAASTMLLNIQAILHTNACNCSSSPLFCLKCHFEIVWLTISPFQIATLN